MDLAHALVTVARLATARHRLVPASTLYLGGSIESRVRRLLGPAEPDTAPPFPIWVASLVVVGTSAVAAVALGRALHDAIEALVAFLP